MNLSRKTKGLFIASTSVIIVLIIINAIIYKPHKKVEDLPTRYTGTALSLRDSIINAPEQWTNAIVLINGNVTTAGVTDCVLDASIFCQFDSIHVPLTIQTKEKIHIKGRFIGYDDLLEEVKLDNCFIIEN